MKGKFDDWAFGCDVCHVRISYIVFILNIILLQNKNVKQNDAPLAKNLQYFNKTLLPGPL
jgi:hypothetical protein